MHRAPNQALPDVRIRTSLGQAEKWTRWGQQTMQKNPELPRKNAEEPVFNFDLERMKAAIESGVVSFPRGLSPKERKEWIRKHLSSLPSS